MGTGLESWSIPADWGGRLGGGESRVSLHCYIHRSQNKRLKGNDSSATVCVPPTMHGGPRGSPGSCAPGIRSLQALGESNLGGPASRCLSLGTRCKGSFLRCSFQLRPIPLLTTPSHQVSSQLYRTHLWLPSRVHAQGLALSVQTLRAQDSNSGLRTQAQGSLRVQS